MKTRNTKSTARPRGNRMAMRLVPGGGNSKNVREADPPPEFEASRPEEPRQPYDGNTAFRLYLREVGQTGLLTSAEEASLARRIKRGDKQARELMIKANLRLVVKIARDYEGYGMPLLDLISEGNVGLMRAVERFDPKKGAKLSTYSAWWIKQNIKRALANQSKTIRLPIHVVDKLFRIKQTSVKLEQLLGRDPTDAELGEELGFSAGKVARLRTAGLRPVSLEAPLGPGGDSGHYCDTVPDQSAEDPSDRLAEKTMAQMVQQLVARLQPRELAILRARFGLDGGEERTLDEVGRNFGLTRERIRQLQNLALAKLRRGLERLETSGSAA